MAGGEQDGHRYDPSHVTAEGTPVPVAAAQSDENLLIQASQILQQMRARTGAVEQREAAVHSEDVRQQQLAADLESQLKDVSAEQQRLVSQKQTLDARTTELNQLQKKLDDQRMSMREQVSRSGAKTDELGLDGLAVVVQGQPGDRRFTRADGSRL